MKVIIYVETRRPINSRYRAQAFLNNLELISTTELPGPVAELVIHAKVKSSAYILCIKCDKIFRAVKGGGPVRHPCKEGK